MKRGYQIWSRLLLASFIAMVLSLSVYGQTITICNKSGTDLRLARFIFRDSSLFGLDCGALGTHGCRSWLWNWRFIGNGYCDEYGTGNFYSIYFAVQLKDRDGGWYSPSYARDQQILDSYDVGWSGISTRTMCVKDSYSAIYDRIVKGMHTEVHNEVCGTGYRKVAVNLYTQTDNNTNFTVTIPYAAPPTPKNYPNVVRSSDGKLSPACGYRWFNATEGDFRVELKPGFVAITGGVRPAKGFRWVNSPSTKECSVEAIPDPKRRVKKNTTRKRVKKQK